MSAFNTARYNQGRYNLDSLSVFYLVTNLVERITSVTASGAEYMLVPSLSERVVSETAVAKGFIVTGPGMESVAQETCGNRIFMLTASDSESVSQSGNIAGAYSVKASHMESIAQSSTVAERVGMILSLAEKITQTASTCQKVHVSTDLNEMVDAVADVEATEESVCSINVTIPPGSTLIVDAVNYNVYLDGGNIVYAHSGDWLDELNRMTQSIKITGTRAGNLTASILYTERYL